MKITKATMKSLYPYEYVDSVFDIDYRKLYDMGVRGLIFDIDNTLVLHGTDSTPEIDALFAEVQGMGFKTLLLSNNDEKRINRFLRNIDNCYYIAEADKPNVKGYLRALDIMELDKSEAVVIGDQVFTDVFGANVAGIPSILVKFLRWPNETDLGKRRRVEQMVLDRYDKRKRFKHRLGNIDKNAPEEAPAEKHQRRNFCELHPAFYAISTQKEIIKRNVKDARQGQAFAEDKSEILLPNLVFEYASKVIKTGPGIDPVLQENKAVNIRLACAQLDGLILHPGELFSFWHTVGKVSKRKGYKDGRVIEQNKVVPGMGGGLCNLGNTVNLLFLHSPLELVEFNTHSDALACDIDHRQPLATGTSIYYNYIDYRVRNNTDQDIQLHVWVEDGQLCGELRSVHAFNESFELTEDDHHFRREGDKIFRVSKIYRDTIDKATGEVKAHDLIWDNHSEVMFPYDMIPEDMIRDE